MFKVSRAGSTRRLLRVKDLIDAHYAEPLDLRVLARAAGISTAHFSRQFRQTFGETEICRAVGLRSVGSFTTSFGRAFGRSPLAYRTSQPPDADAGPVPDCAVRMWARPGY
jgi:AraC-like DNA-binding protein